MRTGSETLASIEQALSDITQRESELRRELEQANSARASLAAERLASLKELADVRVHDAIADGVIDEADKLSHQVRNLLTARMKSISALQERSAVAERERTDLIKKLDELNHTIAALEEKLDQFAAAAQKALGADPDYVKQKTQYQELSSMLERAKARAEQVGHEEQEKSAPYLSDPLFMYLWRRGVGTPAYKATGLIRFLDEWVAGLIRYTDARANYAMLTEIPVRLKAHADRLQDRVVGAQHTLDAVEAEKTHELAGMDLTNELKTARDLQTVSNEQLEAITAELTEAGSQLKLYANGEDQSFRDAVDFYAKFLKDESLRQLMSEAFATATSADDRIVARARDLEHRIEKLQRVAKTGREKFDELYERKKELIQLSSKFRRARYDDVASEFTDNPSLQELLRLLLQGAISTAEYWARTQGQQRWRQRPADPWRRQSGIPPIGQWPWGTGAAPIGRGARRAGGSIGGRDFETGGGF
jgi:chromosome segregation ATPase